MRIVCLGWGSLLWKPGPLPIDDNWRGDGPLMPIEFARVGDGGELATVVCSSAPPGPVYWVPLAVTGLDDAMAALREREQIPAERSDGVGLLKTDPRRCGQLNTWALGHGIDALIWTALPPRFQSVEHRVPSASEAVRYLQSLEGETLAHAKEYIQRVPEEIDTPHRRVIERELGWRSTAP